MMQYDFTEKSTVISNVTMEGNTISYPTYQQNIFPSTVSDSNMMITGDIWSSSPSNSNRNSQSFYFPSSLDSQEFHSADTHYFNYQPSFDIPSTSLIDPYSHAFPNHYPPEPYSRQTEYNVPPIESATYFTSTNSYENFHPIYTNPDITLPTSTLATDYQSPWHIGESKMYPPHPPDDASISNSQKQPCLVCQEESSGYHFGAYTCESCKAFYGRITKDPTLDVKHSCDIPLPNITKLNRKDCRACRKAKCEQVGMTISSKDRLSRRKTTTTAKSSLLSIENLLVQLRHDLTYHQLSTSSALENLFHLLDLPSIIPITFDYHSLYMNAIQIWRNQYHHSSQLLPNISFNETFAVLLFLFYSLMIMKENHTNQSTDHLKFDKLVNILQQEIHRITGIDHRLASRIKALFMKCYVALAQYHPNSTNISYSNHNEQSIFPYQQYPICG